MKNKDLTMEELKRRGLIMENGDLNVDEWSKLEDPEQSDVFDFFMRQDGGTFKF